MKSRLFAAAALVLSAAPVGIAVAPTALAAEPCTPTVTMGKASQDSRGIVTFPVSYTVCDNTSRLTIKYRDRDAGGWGTTRTSGMVTGSYSSYLRFLPGDGQAHRWVAYATLKQNQGGALLAQTPKVYFRSTPPA